MRLASSESASTLLLSRTAQAVHRAIQIRPGFVSLRPARRASGFRVRGDAEWMTTAGFKYVPVDYKTNGIGHITINMDSMYERLYNNLS